MEVPVSTGHLHRIRNALATELCDALFPGLDQGDGNGPHDRKSDLLALVALLEDYLEQAEAPPTD